MEDVICPACGHKAVVHISNPKDLADVDIICPHCGRRVDGIFLETAIRRFLEGGD